MGFEESESTDSCEEDVADEMTLRALVADENTKEGNDGNALAET